MTTREARAKAKSEAKATAAATAKTKCGGSSTALLAKARAASVGMTLPRGYDDASSGNTMTLAPGFENGLGWGVAYIPPIADDAMDGAPELLCLEWEGRKATTL